MPRSATSYSEVRKILKTLVDKSLTSKSKLVATISRNSIDEILSGRAVSESFDKQAHVQAAANIDHLFSNAIEPWKFELNPNKQNGGLKDIRRLYAPMEYKSKLKLVKITVKELINPRDGNRLYSVEAIDVDLE